jgi:hypothetical protein
MPCPPNPVLSSEKPKEDSDAKTETKAADPYKMALDDLDFLWADEEWDQFVVEACVDKTPLTEEELKSLDDLL